MKDLSDEKVSEALAAVMGVCVHEWEYSGLHRTYSFKCIKCGSYEIIPIVHFTAFSPDGIWQWKAYMEKEMAEEWEMYLKECLSIATLRICFTDIVKETYAEAFTKQLSPRHLAGFLKKELDKQDGWGYEERYCDHCRKGSVQMHWTHPCEQCGCIGGKVLTEKARKFKTIVEGEGK
jgi:hypothetical protein